METEQKSGTPWTTKIIAGVVLLVAAYVLFHVILGFLTAIGGFLLILVAVVGVIWAISVLF
jgi:UPF0716 family protein affecting phage T7 exclusion